MIVTERFVFIHMHKTGGQTLNRIIGECFPEREVIGYHYPRAELPEAHAHLPVVGFVRNPWDWYVSWYAFNTRPGIRNPLFAVVSEDGTADFATTIRNLVDLGAASETARRHRDRLIELLPETLDANRGVGLTKDSIRSFGEDGGGYLAWQFRRMLDPDAGATHVGRFEQLEDEFLRVMAEVGVIGIESIRREFRSQERHNTSSHSHYSHYFDDELRDLVADRERQIVDDFGYGFERVGPVGSAAAADRTGSEGFRKLLGRADNYLKLADAVDVSALAHRLSDVTTAEWGESGRERRFDVHKHTQALMLVHFEDHKHSVPDYRERFDEYAELLAPILAHIGNFYGDNGFVVRLIFAKLAAGGSIPEHSDTGYSLLNCHRVHVPIVTNEQVVFSVGGEQKHMRAGEFWEINNGGPHAVVNRGAEDRIHLIVDWMPNPQGHALADVLTPGHVGGEQETMSQAESLDLMLVEAFHTQRAGDARKARALYKQVLDIDPQHVEANNLLGLLCLQAGQPQEAVAYIGRALDKRPDDAQACANLGLALKDLGRFDEAAREFERALALNPDNPRVRNNLGGVLCQLGRWHDAVGAFREAVSRHPEYAEAHRNLGAALLRCGQFNDGIASIERALALKPDFQQARLDLEQAARLAATQRGQQ